MIEIILTFFLASSFYQGQTKYDYCKEKEFKTEYCKTQKELNRLGEKYAKKSDNK